jgi:hypothetical protein
MSPAFSVRLCLLDGFRQPSIIGDGRHIKWRSLRDIICPLLQPAAGISGQSSPSTVFLPPVVFTAPTNASTLVDDCYHCQSPGFGAVFFLVGDHQSMDRNCRNFDVMGNFNDCHGRDIRVFGQYICVIWRALLIKTRRHPLHRIVHRTWRCL